jgi:hypothetical protein
MILALRPSDVIDRLQASLASVLRPDEARQSRAADPGRPRPTTEQARSALVECVKQLIQGYVNRGALPGAPELEAVRPDDASLEAALQSLERARIEIGPAAVSATPTVAPMQRLVECVAALASVPGSLPPAVLDEIQADHMVTTFGDTLAALGEIEAREKELLTAIVRAGARRPELREALASVHRALEELVRDGAILATLRSATDLQNSLYPIFRASDHPKGEPAHQAHVALVEAVLRRGFADTADLDWPEFAEAVLSGSPEILEALDRLRPFSRVQTNRFANASAVLAEAQRFAEQGVLSGAGPQSHRLLKSMDAGALPDALVVLRGYLEEALLGSFDDYCGRQLKPQAQCQPITVERLKALRLSLPDFVESFGEDRFMLSDMPWLDGELHQLFFDVVNDERVRSIWASVKEVVRHAGRRKQFLETTLGYRVGARSLEALEASFGAQDCLARLEVGSAKHVAQVECLASILALHDTPEISPRTNLMAEPAVVPQPKHHEEAVQLFAKQRKAIQALQSKRFGHSQRHMVQLMAACSSMDRARVVSAAVSPRLRLLVQDPGITDALLGLMTSSGSEHSDARAIAQLIRAAKLQRSAAVHGPARTSPGRHGAPMDVLEAFEALGMGDPKLWETFSQRTPPPRHRPGEPQAPASLM